MTSTSRSGSADAEHLDADLPVLAVPTLLRPLVAEVRRDVPGLPRDRRPVLHEGPHDRSRALGPQREARARPCRRSRTSPCGRRRWLPRPARTPPGARRSGVTTSSKPYRSARVANAATRSRHRRDSGASTSCMPTGARKASERSTIGLMLPIASSATGRDTPYDCPSSGEDPVGLVDGVDPLDRGDERLEVAGVGELEVEAELGHAVGRRLASCTRGCSRGAPRAPGRRRAAGGTGRAPRPRPTPRRWRAESWSHSTSISRSAWAGEPARVGAVGAVDRHAPAAGDEPDDLVARHRRAAAREPDHHVVEALDVHARGAAPLRRGAAGGR